VQVALILVHSGSFSIECRDEQPDAAFNESSSCERNVYYVYCFLSVVFSVELFLRTISKRSLRELCSFLWWVDLIAIMPFYLNLLLLAVGLPENWEAQALASCFRMLRLFKLFRLNSDTATLTRALSLSWRPLSIPLMLLFLGSILLGSIIYAVEQAELGRELADTTFPDVGTGVWFMIVTFSTVGYGDVSPKSHSGRAVTVFAIVCGVLFMAMPLSIIGNNFTLAWEERKKLDAVVALQRHCIDRGLQAREITALFEEADVSGDGTITYLEFRAFMDHIGMALKPSEARNLFAAFDDAKTGVITFYEFCHLVFPDLDVERLSANLVMLPTPLQKSECRSPVPTMGPLPGNVATGAPAATAVAERFGAKGAREGACEGAERFGAKGAHEGASVVDSPRGDCEPQVL